MTTVDEHQVRLTAHEAQANLRTMLELCSAGKLRCSEKTGRPASATVASVAAHLVRGDFYRQEPIASFAWPLLLQAGGLATVDGGRLQLTAKGLAALRKPAEDVIRGLWSRWLTHGVIDEFSRIDAIKGQGARNVLTAARPRREIVGQALASCPPDQWVGIDGLFATMRRRRHSPTIIRNERALWKLYLVDAHYGSFGYDGQYRWEMVEGRYTLAVLFEYAATLGLVDVEYVDPSGARDDFHHTWGGEDLDALSRYDGLHAIRLTSLGCYALGLAGAPSPLAVDGAALTLLPNLDVVATGMIAQGEELLLSAYAERTGDRVWAVSVTSLLRALDAGRDLAEFVDFLTERAETELPSSMDFARRCDPPCSPTGRSRLCPRDRMRRPSCGCPHRGRPHPARSMSPPRRTSSVGAARIRTRIPDRSAPTRLCRGESHLVSERRNGPPIAVIFLIRCRVGPVRVRRRRRRPGRGRVAVACPACVRRGF